MEKFITNQWGKKIRMVHQPEIINYIKNNPGMTEAQIMEDLYDFRRGGFESNKKYAECLRRALDSGKIRREFINNRYRYYIVEETNTSELPELKVGDMVIVDNEVLLKYDQDEYIDIPVKIIENHNNTPKEYLNVAIPNNTDGGLNVSPENLRLVKEQNNQDSVRIFKHNLKNENMIKVKSVYTMITVNIPITLGDVSLNVETMIHCGGNINKCDWDVADYHDVTLKGVKVTDVKKLRDFYKEMGIDLDESINEIIESKLTRDTMAYLVDSNVKFQ